MPEYSHIFGTMLMDVNPGMVLISFTKISPVDRSIKKSTLAMPSQPTASKQAEREALQLSRFALRSALPGSWITAWFSRYLSS